MVADPREILRHLLTTVEISESTKFDGIIGVSRDRQTWKRVLILSCRFLADGFENRVEITKFVDDFILFQENSNN